MTEEVTDAMIGRTFTERCRKMLIDQPKQSEFTLSRAGLETLVLDSERFGDANAAVVRKIIEEEEDEYVERMRLRSFDEQITELRGRYPEASIEPSDGGRRLLKVPGVRRSANIWKNPDATLYFDIPEGFPWVQPHRFLTNSDDTVLKHGGQASNIIGPINTAPKELLQWHWAIQQAHPRHTLLQHVHAAARRFEFADAWSRS